MAVHRGRLAAEEAVIETQHAYCKLCRTGHGPDCPRQHRALEGLCEACGIKRPAMVVLQSDHGEWQLCSRCYRGGGPS